MILDITSYSPAGTTCSHPWLYWNPWLKWNPAPLFSENLTTNLLFSIPGVTSCIYCISYCFFPPIVFVFITFSIQWFTGSGKDQSVFVLLNGPAWPGARHQNRPITIIIIIFSIIIAVVFIVTIIASSILSLCSKTPKKLHLYSVRAAIVRLP